MEDKMRFRSHRLLFEDKSRPSVLEVWFRDGLLPIAHGLDMSMYNRLDGLWTYINGSDARVSACFSIISVLLTYVVRTTV